MKLAITFMMITAMIAMMRNPSPDDDAKLRPAEDRVELVRLMLITTTATKRTKPGTTHT